MYQDHLHKITQDSENQRQRRDEIIKSLQTKLSNSEGELQKTRAKHGADEYVLGSLCNNTVKFSLGWPVYYSSLVKP